MHGWKAWMLLKHYLEQGVSKAELSRRFGVSRRTIHYLGQDGADGPGSVDRSARACYSACAFSANLCANLVTLVYSEGSKLRAE